MDGVQTGNVKNKENICMRNVLFVCTGNTCRSPMAEAWLKMLCARDGLACTIGSAGLAAEPGNPASIHAQEVMAARGIDLSHHAARQFSAELADKADLIVAMTRTHLQRIQLQVPAAASKSCLLMHFSKLHPETNVPDPFRGSLKKYETCFQFMEEALENLKNSLTEK